AVLRAGFWHESLGRPVQIIVPKVALPWRRIDLSLLDEAARQRRLADILVQERAERFDLSAPPLLRFTLIRLAAESHRLVLTHHHIFVDGLAIPFLVQEVLAFYAHGGDARWLGDVLPRVTPYRDYLAWIAAQDHGAEIAAWREALAGLSEPTRLAPYDPKRALLAPEQLTLALSTSLTAALAAQGRRHRGPLHTPMPAGWGDLP